MQKDYEVVVVKEVTFTANVMNARNSEDAITTAESLIDEVLEGLGPGPATITGSDFLSADAFEIRGDNDEIEEDD